MSRWLLKRLGDVCETASGGTPLKSNTTYYNGGTIPWLLSGEVSQGEIRSSDNFITPRGLENSSAKIFPVDTVLVAMYGATAGQVGILRIPAATNQAVCGILPNKNFVSKFIYYLMLSKKNELVAKAVGNAQPNVSQIKIRELRVPVIPTCEQKRIVSILDKAFDAIATAKANTEKNLQNARAIFDVCAQSEFANYDRDEVEKRPLGTLAVFRNGINYTQRSKGDHVTVVGVKDFQRHFWVPAEDLATVTIDGHLGESDLLREGDILTVRSNGNLDLIGRCMVAGEIPKKTSHSGFTIRIRLQNGDLLPEFLCHFMRSGDSKKKLVDSGIGTNIKSLNQQTLSALAVPVPPISAQETLVRKLEAISADSEGLISLCARKLSALDELKQSLLNKAFAGEL